MNITIAARHSPLSKVQVDEILNAIRAFRPEINFTPTFVQTTGDLDQSTSLRTLDKTDFFTKEIDQLILNKNCRIGIHSAKDLPDPLPKHLKCIALTRGLDPSDVLVLRNGENFDDLPANAIIATSSFRREEMVKELRQDLKFVDIRGTIHKRLEALDSHEVDGVVIAEAALIRLNLTHLNRIKLPGPTALNQGRLAIVARDNDVEMESLFAPINVSV